MNPELLTLLRETSLLLLATVLGGAVGWQREAQARPAGLRTHALVCLGACLLTQIRLPGGDPGRIAAQIVTGIGFLGAGVILRRGAAVRGLTTAASVWMVAAIGIATGAGGRYALLAAITTALGLMTLTLGKRLERFVRRTTREATLVLSIPRSKGAVANVLATITGSGAAILSFEEEANGPPEHYNPQPGRRGLIVTIRMDSNVTQEELTGALAEALPDVQIVWT